MSNLTTLYIDSCELVTNEDFKSLVNAKIQMCSGY